MNPNQSAIYDDPRAQQARTAYEGAERAATGAEASAISLPTLLKDALNKKFSADNPLVQEREGALKNYLNVSAQAPLDVTHKSAGGTTDYIFNPMQQWRQIQERKSAALAPLSTANLLLGISRGGMNDIIDSASRAGQAEATRIRGEAQLKRQSYSDILNELSSRAEEAFRQKQLQESIAGRQADEAFRERQFQESIRQFNTQEGRMGKASGGGGGFDIAGLLSRQPTQGAATARTPIDNFEHPDKKQTTKPQPKVNLSASVNAAKIPGTQQLSGGGNSGWALQPAINSISNWLKGFSAPSTNVKTLQQLGLQ